MNQLFKKITIWFFLITGSAIFFPPTTVFSQYSCDYDLNNFECFTTGFCPVGEAVEFDCNLYNSDESACHSYSPSCEPCGDDGEICCGWYPPYTCNTGSSPTSVGSRPCSCVAQFPPTPTNAPAPTPTPSTCGNLGQPCCDPVPPSTLYTCNGDLTATNPSSPVCLCGSSIPTTAPLPTPTDSPNADVYCDDGGIRTAIGCVPTESRSFTSWFLGLAIPIGGVISFVVLLYASLQLVLSAGDPQKIQNARSLLTAALSGLILIILSIFILRLIGTELFDIPGF